MRRRFTAVITRDRKWYIAHCLELGVVSQGTSAREAKKNLKAAVELYIKSFGPQCVPAKTNVVLTPFEVSTSA